MPLLFLVDRVGISGFSYLFIYLFLPEKKKKTHMHTDIQYITKMLFKD